MGRIATFYSYKGGSGRSMALANVAWVLASQGAHVLVVDWDLEAPGLHRYFRPFLLDKELTRLESQGVIDFVISYTERLAARADTTERETDSEWWRVHADISKWSQRLLWPSGEDALTSRGGTIDFVPAGRQGAQYARRVNSFDWGKFYDRCNGGAFMEAVRASMTKYDWVLLDSRTGVSDTAGICTVQLPDTLVVCFTLNYQSIDGAVAVASSAAAARAKGRPLRILPLPTRLDGNEEKLLNAMMAYAQRSFSQLLDPRVDATEYWKHMGVPYFSRYAYSEKLSPFEDQVNVSTSTLPSMERLATYLNDARPMTLVPLPEPYRRQVLKEFERLPDAAGDAASPMPLSRAAVLRIGFRQAMFRATSVAIRPAVLVAAVLILGIGVFGWFTALRPGTVTLSPGANTAGAVPIGAITLLTEDARKALENNRREHAALLIAEAASRLGGDAIVSPQGEPAKHVYDAFLALQPIKIADAAPGDGTQSVVFSPDGRRLAFAGQKQTVRLFSFPPQAQDVGRPIGYSAVAFSPDSRYVAAGGRNGSLTVSDAIEGRRVWQWENPDPHSAWVTAIAFSPNGDLLAFATDTEMVTVVRVDTWTVASKARLDARRRPAVTPLEKGIGLLVFSLDSAYLLADAELLNTRDGARYPTPTYLTGAEAIAAVPSGHSVKVAFVNGDMSFGVADVGTMYPAAVAGGPSTLREANFADLRPTGPLALSPNGRVAIAFPKTVRLVERRSNDLRFVTGYDVSSVRTIVFVPDGRRFVVGFNDGLTMLTIEPNPRITPIPWIPQATVASLAVSPNGKYLAVGSKTAVFTTFLGVHTDASGPADLSFSAAEVQSFACSQVRENLSAEEWKHYFGAEPLRYTCRPATEDRRPRPSVS